MARASVSEMSRREWAFSTSTSIISAPSPMPHIADDRLSTLVHPDVLHRHPLLANGSVALEGLDLCRKGPGELIQGALRTVLLRKGLHMREPTRECHGRHMNSGHLRRKHGFHLIFWLCAFDYGQHEIKLALVHFSALRSSIGELSDQYCNKAGIGRRKGLHEEGFCYAKVGMVWCNLG